MFENIKKKSTCLTYHLGLTGDLKEKNDLSEQETHERRQDFQ